MLTSFKKNNRLGSFVGQDQKQLALQEIIADLESGGNYINSRELNKILPLDESLQQYLLSKFQAHSPLSLWVDFRFSNTEQKAGFIKLYSQICNIIKLDNITINCEEIDLEQFKGLLQDTLASDVHKVVVYVYTPEQFVAINQDFYSSHKILHELALNFNYYTEKDENKDYKLLDGMIGKVQQIVFYGIPKSTIVISSLHDFLKKNTILKGLKIVNNNGDQIYANPLLIALQENKHAKLEVLDFYQCPKWRLGEKCKDDFIVNLVKYFSQPDFRSELKILKLDNCGLCSTDIEYISEIIKNSDKLEEVSLNRNEAAMSERSIGILSKAIQSSKLRKLDISSITNCNTDKIFLDFLDQLHLPDTLEALYCTDNVLGMSGWEKVQSLLARSPNLKKVSISINLSYEKDLDSFVKSINCFTTLGKIEGGIYFMGSEKSYIDKDLCIDKYISEKLRPEVQKYIKMEKKNSFLHITIDLPSMQPINNLSSKLKL